jgi:outer membrane protein OmpA-like peptidoglycan-associated protein
MRNRHLILVLSILIATFLVAGCGSARQVTKAETDQFNAISAKLAGAEGMTPKGAKVCAPKELGAAMANLDAARHEATESWEVPASYIVAADKSADVVVAKTKACQPPVVKYSAAPETITKGECSTLTWSTQNVQKAEIDQEVGAVAASGSKQVCPTETTPYILTATGTGGTVYETATVTVKAPAPPPPPPKAVAPVVVPVAAPKPATVTLRVNFDTNKYTIRPADLAELQKAIEFAKKNPDAKIHVVGYTDSTGSAKLNQKLSENRAEAVKKYLVGEGPIAGEKITSEGKGAADPIGDNKTKEGKFLNRRVEIREAK